MLDVGCGKLISEEGTGVSVCCLLKSVEGIPLLLLPQGMAPTLDANPTHGRETRYFHSSFVATY